MPHARRMPLSRMPPPSLPPPHRRVSPEDIAACEERYNKSKMVSARAMLAPMRMLGSARMGGGHARSTAHADARARQLQVHSIMRHIAETTGSNLEELYNQIAWPLYRIFGHAFDAFKVCVQ
jgi:translation initiation factor 2 subunit 1